MRNLRWPGRAEIDDDPDGVIRDCVEYALSWPRVLNRPAPELLAEWFAPDGPGMVVPDLFVAYRAQEAGDLPADRPDAVDPRAGEYWVLTRLRSRADPEASAIVAGPELRHLLAQGVTARGLTHG
ncbi:hypothetical protein EDD29_3566 [Actinocorallia herbida]|uniref:Uncharacterized protein n=1 Tax=Actinocorallia herbida TaxID=58109 RepID=A0A3N1CXM7_9ACTN|nr:hypothetical protein [Actinocorallia herbida]ROO86005.1 hypothetical protein EDD29_3566 [Actinocorallia herbida]